MNIAMETPGGNPRRLVVSDVDSTFIKQEVIELIAHTGGVGEQVAAITARAMNGELEFADSLRQRVTFLRGCPLSVLHDVTDALELNDGALELLEACQERDWPLGLVSGGFHEVVDPLAEKLGITLVAANRFEIVDGRLTGKVEGPIIDRAEKAATLRRWASEYGVPLSECVAIGDGANDLDMLREAGYGVAFRAKAVVAEAARFELDGPLNKVLDFIPA
ncbi:MAG: phosphoserine phosphatase SerB [Cellulomonadaceae bacterium]|jgi:phosphoserine phosphatase|nr:phosphoserine phosphatase SerB [Cellulomonadaceae bacterium]